MLLAPRRTMPDLGRLLVTLGILLLVAGVIVLALGRLHIPLGRLPGDLRWQGRNTTISFPLVTCLLLSVLLSAILWIANRFFR